MNGRLRVRVNDDLVLDAGTCENSSGVRGAGTVIRPPETTIFHQVLAYLKSKPDPSNPLSGSRIGHEGVAAAAVTVRWGTYFAVLADRDRPTWSVAHSTDTPTSRISDGEMARINIEASAAMAEWVDLYRSHSGMGFYAQLVDRAVAYLPMPRKTSKREAYYFASLSDPGIASRILQSASAEQLASAQPDAERYPSRLFANAMVNFAWRNGPVEKIHAGGCQGYPIDQRRVTPQEERELLHFAGDRMATGMTALMAFVMDGSSRSWSEQVLPYGLAQMLLVTPSGWTLTEASREIRLPG